MPGKVAEMSGILDNYLKSVNAETYSDAPGKKNNNNKKKAAAKIKAVPSQS